ncbi:hypothetical protein AAC387_Pa12g0369 [Persea americana]
MDASIFFPSMRAPSWYHFWRETTIQGPSLNKPCVFEELPFFVISRICFDFFRVIIYSPTCQTVVSDPFLWYSGPAPVFALEEEPEEAVGEPQRLVEWQADDVI